MASGDERVLRWILWWTALTTIIFWLPTVRGAFDGETYEWGNFGLSGRGVHGDYWFPVAGTIGALLTQWLGWRGRARFALYLLLSLWHGGLAAGAIYLAVTRPDDFRFRGDTLGVDISLAAVGTVLFIAWALLVAYWIFRDAQSGKRTIPEWTKTNSRWAVALLLLLPIQFVLLRFGPPHGTTDQAGVLLTIAQWLLVGRALRPRTGAPPA